MKQRLVPWMVEGVQYLCNPSQIEKAGSVENAAKAMHESANPKPKKEKVIQGEKPEEK